MGTSPEKKTEFRHLAKRFPLSLANPTKSPGIFCSSLDGKVPPEFIPPIFTKPPAQSPRFAINLSYLSGSGTRPTKQQGGGPRCKCPLWTAGAEQMERGAGQSGSGVSICRRWRS
ncbi:hypothetical protein GCWU000341_01536 [Oribacterium sp. oral taxon 078 str. F0262]|nr:hypothetical protein GCWU000341_01536 [Oribacterium sp. oral taxon 078 str. F0262]